MAMSKAEQNAALRAWLNKGSARTRATQKRLNPTGRKADTSGWATAPAPVRLQPAPSSWRPPSTPSYSPAPAAAPTWTRAPASTPQPAPSFVLQPATPPVAIQAPNYQPPTLAPAEPQQPPDPLGFYPGGSEGFYEVLGQLPGAAWNAVRGVPGAVWEGGADLGIDLTTPGTNARGREKARAQAKQVADAQRVVDKIVDENKKRREKENAPDRKEKVYELTPEEWAAMSPQQQAAVQFNGDLVQAVQRDRNRQDWYEKNVGQAERVAYDNAVESMFGTTNQPTVEGIEYAPETVALLQQLDLPTVRSGDKTLDDYLKLDVAITAKDVKNIDQALTPTRTGAQEWEFSERDQRLRHAQMLSRAQERINTQGMQDQMAVGEQLLAGTTRQTANELASEEFGAKERKAGMDNISVDEAKILDEYVAGLANPTVDLDEAFNMIQADLSARGATPDDQKRLFSAMSDFLGKAATGRADWFSEQQEAGQEFRNPQEIAKAAGISLVSTRSDR